MIHVYRMSASPTRSHAIARAGRYRRLVADHTYCVYCGARATTVDHFAPVSVVASLLSLGIDMGGRFLVPACGECNSIASDGIFRSIGAKRRYIQRRLVIKYKRVLAIPDWSNEEIDQFGYVLGQSVRAGLAHRDFIRMRVRWKNSQNAEPAKLAAVSLRYSVLKPINTAPVLVMRKPAGHVPGPNYKDLGLSPLIDIDLEELGLGTNWLSNN